MHMHGTTHYYTLVKIKQCLSADISLSKISKGPSVTITSSKFSYKPCNGARLVHMREMTTIWY